MSPRVCRSPKPKRFLNNREARIASNTIPVVFLVIPIVAIVQYLPNLFLIRNPY